MSYVDGFVVPVPKGNRDLYLASAAKAWPSTRGSTPAS